MYDEKLKKLCSQLKTDEPMDRHTSFRAGGRARYFAEASDVEELRALLRYAGAVGIPHYILGKGSNTLVSDRGYDGLIIKLGEAWSALEYDESTGLITAGAGAGMASVAVLALKHGLSGFEGLSGIPGSIGGAVAMNAGAYGYEMSGVLSSVRLLDEELNEISLNKDELDLGYRHSIFTDSGRIALSAVIKLEKGSPDAISEKMRDLAEKRAKNQPLELPSAGSTFKRPEGYFAGRLIEDSGLKGVCVGDACVSEKHAGFVVNKGGASATEIYQLICYIRSKVYAEFGVRLEPEVRLIGEF